MRQRNGEDHVGQPGTQHPHHKERQDRGRKGHKQFGIGLAVGGSAGLLGGRADRGLMRLAELFMTFPTSTILAYQAQCDSAMARITLVSPVPNTPTIKNDRIEVFMTFPTSILSFFMVGVLGTGLTNVILAIALSHWGTAATGWRRSGGRRG
jgi:hypothetical protein